jgi:anthranilate phosphoribosyltransferase
MAFFGSLATLCCHGPCAVLNLILMNPEFPKPVAGISLSREEILSAVALLCDSDCAEEKKGAFLSSLNQRGESAYELAGFAEALLSDALPPELQAVRPRIERDEAHPLVELCGTGGDKAGLLNISTAAMFVAAGGGARVVKHGNRAVSSQCGSADVLEALGVTLHLEASKIPEILDRAGCVFLLASDFHPAVALIAPVRRALAVKGVRTIFNLLGPLLNPARPEVQLTGVYQKALLPRYADAMRLLGRRRAWAVNGRGVDELTVEGVSSVVEVFEGQEPRKFGIDPREYGLFHSHAREELLGGNAGQNAARIRAILSGEERGAARDMIVLNAAAALYLAGNFASLEDGMEQAVNAADESLNSGRALEALENLVRLSWSRI